MDSNRLPLSKNFRIQLSGNKHFPEQLYDPFQTWILEHNKGIRPCLGLRSQSSKLEKGFFIHPIFREGAIAGSDPRQFFKPPQLGEFSWDWIEYDCQPFKNLPVSYLHWIPDPRAACGYLRVENSSDRTRRIILEVMSQIPGSSSSIKLSGDKSGGRQILSGSWEDQSCAFFLTGGKNIKEIHSGLSSEIILKPGCSQELRWILISAPSAGLANDHLTELLCLDWAGEIARRKIQKQQQLSIHTGNPERDLLLAKSQQQARLIFRILLLQTTSEKLPASALISPLQAWLLYQALYPLSTADMKGLLKLAFADHCTSDPQTKYKDEYVDWLPMSAELLWEAHQAGFPPEVWVEYLPVVEQRIQNWFHPDRDRDGDRIPELPQVRPNIIKPGSSGRIPYSHQNGFQAEVEHPGLSGILLNEIHKHNLLLKAINFQGIQADHTAISSLQELEDFIEQSWLDSKGRFQCRDFQTHRWLTEGYRSQPLQEGWNSIEEQPLQPCHLELVGEVSPTRGYPAGGRITIHGRDWMGRSRVEEISISPYIWKTTGTLGVSRCRYARVEYCRIQGFGSQGTFHLQSNVNHNENISSLLALWKPGLPDHMFNTAIEKNLQNTQKYWTCMGLSTFPGPDAGVVQLPWNILLTRLLIDHGNSQLALKLINSWIKAGLINNQVSGKCYPEWDSESGLGWGKEDWIEGLFPIKMFLDGAGIRIQVDDTLILKDQSDISDRMQVKYRGTIIERLKNSVMVQYPGEEPRKLSSTGIMSVQLFRSSSANSST